MKRSANHAGWKPWTCPKCQKAFPSGFGHGSHLRWCQNREAHFWRNVDKTSSPIGCWLYTGTISFEGYGYVNISSGVKRQQWQAHRFAWTLLKGPIPEGQCVLHTCDVRHCVNPEHLYLGDRKDNARDKIIRRRDTGATLSYEQVQEVRRLLAEGKLFGYQIAEQMGVSPAVITGIRTGRTFRYVPDEQFAAEEQG
jgi:hypothetical protein